MRNTYVRVLAIVCSIHLMGGVPTTNAADSLVTNFWTGIDGDEAHAQRLGTEKQSVGKGTSRLLRIDLRRLRSQVVAASSASSFNIALPAPDGTEEQFNVRSSSVMPPGLAERYPTIKAYEGVAMDDPSVTIRMEITDKGLSAQILGPNKRWLIDPADDGDSEVSRSYKYGTSLKSEREPFCELDTRKSASGWQSLSPEFKQGLRAKSTSGAIKTFRTAVATTGEYGVYHGRTAAGVLSAVVVTMNRVDGIFEPELGISLELVDNNDLIVFTDTVTDPFTGNDDASVLIDESQVEIDARIGAENYDVGHTLSTGAGGLASLGAVCRPGFKAQGVTGSGRPEGDFFDVDYVAHELGHQFAADHTWNGSGGGCGPQQRGAGSAYEPGSGSSIMSYAGLCGADNIASAVDALFHHQSFEEIITYTTEGFGAACGTESDIGNTVPEVSAGADYVVPKQTPLVVFGSATDVQQVALQFSWEQRDLGPQAALTDPDDGRIPLFRMLPSASNGTRYLPALSTVVSGSTSLSERIPQIGRDMNMRLTVKDGVGGVQSDDIMVTVDGNSGPFTVVSPNGGERVGGSRTIRWDSAFTEQAPVSASVIDVYLSTDAGVSFDQLIGSVDNTGIATLAFPSGIQSSTALVMLRGADNIFYDVSDGVFELDTDRAVPATPAAERIDAGDAQLTLVFSPGVGSTVVADSFEAYCATAPTVTETPFSLDVVALPFDENMPITSDLEVTKDFTIESDGLKVPVNITHTYRGDVIIDLTSPAGTTVRLKDDSLPNDGEDNVVETYPTTAAPSESLSAFEGESTLGTWTLTVSDFQVEDSGQLESWGITVVSRSPQSEGAASATQSPITVGGLVNGEEYACTVTAVAAGWPGESVSFERATPTGSTDSSLTPSFGAPVATSDGFTVQVSNYDDIYSWAVTSTAGSASINTSGLVTLTGLTPGQSATVTVTTTRAGVDDGSADVSGSASVADALTPSFDTPSSTADGFTVHLNNYDPDYTWTVVATAGDASISGSGLVSVEGLTLGQTATVTVSTSRSGFASASEQLTGSALSEAPPLPTISVANLELSTTDFKGGDGDSVVLSFTAQSDIAADAQIDALVIASSGALNESSDVGQVKVFVDVNGDGAPEASERVAESAFSADNGSITFEFSEPIVLTTDSTRMLITYEL
ncbi:M12 family metallo-peptidase [Luminiphilus sp.]|nr:M12 family metallo-peptidase [Luminiphilus sp.]